MAEIAPNATARKRIPNRRAHEVVAFEHEGRSYIGGVGRFGDGRVAEVFLNGAKVGSALETVARDAAIVADVFYDIVCRAAYEPYGEAFQREARNGFADLFAKQEAAEVAR